MGSVFPSLCLLPHMPHMSHKCAGMREAQAREIFGASRYVIVKFKISRRNCHEFYAVDAQGSMVEAYQHPITGQEVRATRFQAPSARYPRCWPSAW